MIIWLQLSCTLGAQLPAFAKLQTNNNVHFAHQNLPKMWRNVNVIWSYYLEQFSSRIYNAITSLLELQNTKSPIKLPTDSTVFVSRQSNYINKTGEKISHCRHQHCRQQRHIGSNATIFMGVYVAFPISLLFTAACHNISTASHSIIFSFLSCTPLPPRMNLRVCA